jgi:hypothetical protein
MSKDKLSFDEMQGTSLSRYQAKGSIKSYDDD